MLARFGSFKNFNKVSTQRLLVLTKIVSVAVFGGIAAFDGDRFTTLCDTEEPSKCGVEGGEIYAMAAVGSSLYVGGSFTQAGNIAARHIALWSVSKWQSIGDMDGDVNAMAVFDGILVVAGAFRSVHPAFCQTETTGKQRSIHLAGIATYFNGVWASLGAGTHFEVHSLAVFGPCLYACGSKSDSPTFSTGTARWCDSPTSDALPGPVWEVVKWGSTAGGQVSCSAIATV